MPQTDANIHRHGERLHSRPNSGPHRHLRLVRRSAPAEQAHNHADHDGHDHTHDTEHGHSHGLISAALTVGAVLLVAALAISLIIRPHKTTEIEGAAQSEPLVGTAAAAGH